LINYLENNGVRNILSLLTGSLNVSCLVTVMEKVLENY
jgi:hypothetical protein